MKKLLSLILTLAMVLALSVCAFASGEPSAEAPQPQTAEEYNAYVNFLKEYIRTVDLASVNPDFVEDGRDMCINELDGCGFGSDVYAFPFEMIINELKAPTYAEFIASQKAEPRTQEEYDAYVDYLREHIRSVDLSEINPNFPDDAREMCINELDSCGFGSDVYAFPFEMIVNETKALTYDEFVKASGEPSGEASTGFDGYVAYLDAYIRANVEPDFVGMALGDLYAATEAQAIAEEFPFEMFTGAHGALSYAQWQEANR